jgi:hypothetical protein
MKNEEEDSNNPQNSALNIADVMFSLSDVIGHTVRYKNGNVLKVCGGSELGLLHINEDTQTTFGFGRLENIIEIID